MENLVISFVFFNFEFIGSQSETVLCFLNNTKILFLWIKPFSQFNIDKVNKVKFTIMHRSLFQHEGLQTYSVTLRFMVSFFPGCLALVDRHFGYHRPGASTKDPKVLEFFAVSTLILSLSCAKHLCSVSLLDSFHHFNMIFCCSW